MSTRTSPVPSVGSGMVWRERGVLRDSRIAALMVAVVVVCFCFLIDLGLGIFFGLVISDSLSILYLYSSVLQPGW